MVYSYKVISAQKKIKKKSESAAAVFSLLKSPLSSEDKAKLIRFRGDTAEKIESYEKKIYEKAAPLFIEVFLSDEPLKFEEREKGEFHRFEVGETWSKKLFGCGWFHITGKIPENEDKKGLVCRIDISGEGLVTDKNGEPLRGITTFSSQYDYSLGMPEKREIPVDERICENGKIDFYIDGANNDLFGDKMNSGRIMRAEIARENRDLISVKYAFRSLLSLFDCLKDSEREKKLSIAASSEKALELLQKGEYKNAAEILREEIRNGEKTDFTVTAVGHGHLDLAWLWPIRETLRKGARTFSTQLENAENYPGYIFGASQAQLFMFMKKNYPSLYERIKQAVKEGKIDIQGAAWVESDTNVPDGESLIRQMLYGKRFFKEEFGIEPKLLWLPDTFGYTASLPQILSKCDIPYFITQKLSWNTVNKFPYQSFNWSGNGPGEVLAHLLPANTYNSPITPEEVRRIEETYTERDVSDKAFMAFGIGDGGGGPGEAHLERFERVRESGFVPNLKYGKTEEFMESLNEDREKYPSYKGELYLEKHQGTYTTQGRNKKYNRLMEIWLRECEFASSAANRLCGYDYPKERLEEIWQEVLLYQFHDILPGSSIKRVYDESCERYALLLDEVKALTEKAYNVLAEDMKGNVLFNMQSFPKKTGETIVPPLSFIAAPPEKELKGESETGGNILENSHLKAVFSEDGCIESLFSKDGNFEACEKGKVLNELVIYSDFGDCWDIFPANYDKLPSSKAKLVSQKFMENEDSFFVKQKYRFGKSEINQKIILEKDGDLLRFETEADWFERCKMLRARFPLSVKSKEAKFNIQFGHISRSTGHESSIEKARWEVSAHRWVDISESDKGVSLLSARKYGFKAWDNTISINLLRSPSFPGKQADMGHHSFTYAVYPHKGGVSPEVYERGCLLDTPLCSAKGEGKSTKGITLFKRDNKAIIFSSLKMSENDDGFILKAYSSSEKEETAELSSEIFSFIKETNLCERPIADLSGEKEITVKFKPFEVKAFLVR